MKRKHDNKSSPHSHGISRREFLKIAAASLLAGCTPSLQPEATPTATPRPTDTPKPTPVTDIRRPDIIRTYPEVASKVVHARHASAWDGEQLAPGAIRQMLDSAITELTGIDRAGEAWAALFAPDERIAIKVNTINSSSYWTHVPVAMVVAKCLQDVGVPPGQIVIFDRYTIEMEDAGFPINKGLPGVRCHGTDLSYTTDWTVMDTEVGLSDVLLGCDALINVPLLKQHGISGITFAMKNHYGTFDKPEYFHGGRIGRGIAEINGLRPIKDRTRLIVGDALAVVRRGWHSAVTADSILMSFDPVAHDTVGLQLYCDVMAAKGDDPGRATDQANTWLEESANLGLGTSNLENIDLVEVRVG